MLEVVGIFWMPVLLQALVSTHLTDRCFNFCTLVARRLWMELYTWFRPGGLACDYW